MTHNCKVCGDGLNNDNWAPAGLKNRDYICRECKSEKGSLYRKNNPEKIKATAKRNNTARHRRDGCLPMSENKECSAYLGVYRTERLLRHLFNDVEVMPYGHKGYDFICNNGWKVDAKSSCIRKNRNDWVFNINYNTEADYFFCVAYDNRQDLNIIHVWMLPGDKFNHLTTASISKSTIHKWDEYKKSIDDVVLCCDEIRAHSQ